MDGLLYLASDQHRWKVEQRWEQRAGVPPGWRSTGLAFHRAGVPVVETRVSEAHI